MNLATDGHVATVVKFLATDGHVATVVQTLLEAVGARKKWGIGASLLKADGSLLKADGARKQWGIGAWVGARKQRGNA